MTTALAVPVVVVGGVSLLGGTPRTPEFAPPVAPPPSFAAGSPEITATPALTLRARTAMAEPKPRPRPAVTRSRTASPKPAPRPTSAPADPIVCYRWWYRVYCRRLHDGDHRPYGYWPYDGRYGSRPRW